MSEPHQTAGPAPVDTTTTSDEVLIERDADLLSLTLNRPRQANALSPSVVESLIDALSMSEGVRACVIRGNGKHFCAGFDLSGLEDLSDGDLLLRFLRIETLLQKVHYAPFPILALGQGSVIGAGADLFAACWQRIAAPDARFAMPGWNFELALGTRRLTKLIGTDAARALLTESRPIDAQRAADIGLASLIAPTDTWSEHTSRFRERATTLSARAVADICALTVADTRSEDMAAIVATAGRPGLKQRVSRHVERVAQRRAKRATS